MKLIDADTLLINIRKATIRYAEALANPTLNNAQQMELIGVQNALKEVDMMISSAPDAAATQQTPEERSIDEQRRRKETFARLQRCAEELKAGIDMLIGRAPLPALVPVPAPPNRSARRKVTATAKKKK